MGQKVNPHGLRVGVINDWNSRWFTDKEQLGDRIVQDYKVREYLKKTFYAAGVPKIEIEREADRMKVFVHCAKPGVIIGAGGAEIEKQRVILEKMVGMPVAMNAVEVRDPDLDSQLVAENIASQLEHRIAFRRAMKQCISRTMRLGAKGIKVMVSGRLNGAEIARSETYHEGTIPLQTLRADIDYGFAEANTTYGKIGVKVWIYKGEVLASSTDRQRRSRDRDDRSKRRGNGRRGDRRGDRRQGGFGGRRDDRRGGQRRDAAPRRPRAEAPKAEAPESAPVATEGGAE